MINNKSKEKIIIVDFGSQVTKLIARRIREYTVFCEILTIHQFNNLKNFKNIKGIILSGGPSTVTKKTHPNISLKIFSKKIPILGICYGLQLISKNLGGKVKSVKRRREFGRATLNQVKSSSLTKNFYKRKKATVWMSHQDAVYKLPKKFITIASTNNSLFTIIENKEKKIYGIQFHPEVTHTVNGKILIKNFIFSICKVKKSWKVGSQKKEMINLIKQRVKNEHVICALSGGVDSSVVALLIHKAIKKRLTCIMVDTGLMRKNEFKHTYKTF